MTSASFQNLKVDQSRVSALMKAITALKAKGWGSNIDKARRRGTMSKLGKGMGKMLGIHKSKKTKDNSANTAGNMLKNNTLAVSNEATQAVAIPHMPDPFLQQFDAAVATQVPAGTASNEAQIAVDPVVPDTQQFDLANVNDVMPKQGAEAPMVTSSTDRSAGSHSDPFADPELPLDPNCVDCTEPYDPYGTYNGTLDGELDDIGFVAEEDVEGTLPGFDGVLESPPAFSDPYPVLDSGSSVTVETMRTQLAHMEASMNA